MDGKSSHQDRTWYIYRFEEQMKQTLEQKSMIHGDTWQYVHMHKRIKFPD